MEDNYNNKLREKLTEKSTYHKNGSVVYDLLFGQLHSDIVTAAKNSTVPLFETVHKEQDIVGLLSIHLSVRVKNLSGSKVDPHLDACTIFSSTLSYAQKKGTYPIMILVMSSLTKSLLLRVNLAYPCSERTIIPKC